MAAFTPKKVSKVSPGVVDGIDDAIFSVKDIEKGSFAVASTKKELKQLMRSHADVVYDEKKGKLYFNENGEAKAGVPRRWVDCLPSSKASQNSVLSSLMGFQLTAMPSLVVVETKAKETPKIRLLLTGKH